MNRITLHLRPEPAGKDAHGRDPAYRLKMLLKPLLRSAGFRCVRYSVDDGGKNDSRLNGESERAA